MIPFRFDAVEHEYIDAVTGVVYPHTTLMLERAGWIDDTWFSEESSVRGKAVHTLTASYDLGAISDPESVDSKYKGWLLAHVKAMSVMQPEMFAVETPIVHSVFRYGTRPDRDVSISGERGVWEVKSGVFSKSHQIQTALQAIAISEQCGVPPEFLGRWCAYYQGNGRYKVEKHQERADFDEAYRIIKVHGQPIERRDECPF